MRLKLIFLILFSLNLFFIFSSFVQSYDSETTHPLLTQKTAQIYNQFYQGNLTSEEIAWLIEGAIKEDTPPRWINHFYDPITGLGWQGEKMGKLPKEIILLLTKIGVSPQEAVSSLNWVKNQELQTRYSLYQGNQTWQKAIYKYCQGNKEEAYKALGHILHLLEDLAVPAHVRQDTHLDFFGLDPGEPYEDWLRKNTHFSHLKDWNPQKESFSCQNLDDCFYKLAKYTQENFFSEGTIGDRNYHYPLVKEIKEGSERDFYYGKNKENKLYPLAYYDRKNKKYSLKDPLVHSAYWQLLSKKTILAGVRLLEIFHQEVIKAQKDKNLIEPPPNLKEAFKDGFPQISEIKLPIISGIGEVYRINQMVSKGREFISSQIQTIQKGLKSLQKDLEIIVQKLNQESKIVFQKIQTQFNFLLKVGELEDLALELKPNLVSEQAPLSGPSLSSGPSVESVPSAELTPSVEPTPSSELTPSSEPVSSAEPTPSTKEELISIPELTQTLEPIQEPIVFHQSSKNDSLIEIQEKINHLTNEIKILREKTIQKDSSQKDSSQIETFINQTEISSLQSSPGSPIPFNLGSRTIVSQDLEPGSSLVPITISTSASTLTSASTSTSGQTSASASTSTSEQASTSTLTSVLTSEQISTSASTSASTSEQASELEQVELSSVESDSDLIQDSIPEKIPNLLPPERPQNFQVISISPYSLTLNWSSPFDSDTPQEEISYFLYYSVFYQEQKEITEKEINLLSSTQKNIFTIFTTSTASTTLILVGKKDSIFPNHHYFFALRAFDGLHFSPLATSSVITPLPKINTLKAAPSAIRKGIDLFWQAPEGFFHSIEKYIIKYGDKEITDEKVNENQISWDEAILVGEIPSSDFSIRGKKIEYFLIENLIPNKDYYFALKTISKFGISSEISNLAKAQAWPGFKDNEDGTITDLRTSLIWPKDSLRFNPSQKLLTFSEAKNYIQKLVLCQNQEFELIEEKKSVEKEKEIEEKREVETGQEVDFNSGAEPTPGVGSTTEADFFLPCRNKGGILYSDWRLPTTEELSSIINYSRINPALYQDYFFNFDFSFPYWTSSVCYRPPVVYGELGSWWISVVDFKNGENKIIAENPNIKKFPENFFLPVRGSVKEISQIGSFQEDNKDIVFDPFQNLIWTKDILKGVGDIGFMNIEIGLSWIEVLKKANEIKIAGYSDWRVPNIQELIFAPQSSYFHQFQWSATPDFSNPQRAWAIHPSSFTLKNFFSVSKTSRYRFRLVRDLREEK